MSDLSTMSLRLLMLLTATALGAQEPVASVLLSKEERAACEAVIVQAIAMGFPDLREARFYDGNLVVKIPETECSSSGISARLPDRRVVVPGLCAFLRSDVSKTIDTGQRPFDLRHDLLDCPLPDVPDDAELTWRLTHFPDEDADRLRAISRLARRLDGKWLWYNPMTIHLQRRGEPEWEVAARSCGVNQAIIEAQDPWWHGSPRPLVLLPASGYSPLTGLGGRSLPIDGILHAVPPATALRRFLHEYFREFLLGSGVRLDGTLNSIRVEEATLPAGTAVAAATSFLTPGESLQEQELTLLDARQHVPLTAAPGAPLVERLASWEFDGLWHGDNWDPPMVLPQLAALERSRFEARRVQRPAMFAGTEMDALVHLLDDPRPCRWLDGKTPRTLGDNALRAVACLLGFDPRAVLDRDIAAPWTAEERHATAVALASWWEDNRQKGIPEIQAEVIVTLAPVPALSMLTRMEETQRLRCFPLLTHAWKKGPTGPVDSMTIQYLLALAGNDSDLVAVLTNWSLHQEGRCAIAVLALREGNTKPFGTLLEAALSDPSGKKAPVPLADLLPVASRLPVGGLIDRCLDLLAGPLNEPRGCAIRDWVVGIQWGDAPMRLLPNVYVHGNKVIRDNVAAYWRTRVLPLTLAYALLDDTRLAPDGMMHELDSHYRGTRDGALASGKAGAALLPPKPPPGMRVADIAAFLASWGVLLSGNPDGSTEEWVLEPYNLHVPPIDRDRALVELKDHIWQDLKSALEAAKLPVERPDFAFFLNRL